MTRVVDKVLTGLARAGFASAEQRWRFKSIRSSPFIFSCLERWDDVSMQILSLLDNGVMLMNL